MNKNIIKLLSFFVVFLFLVSTLGMVSATNDIMTNKNETTINTTVVTTKSNQNTKQADLLPSETSMVNKNPSMTSQNTQSISQINSASMTTTTTTTPQFNPYISPLLQNPAYYTQQKSLNDQAKSLSTQMTSLSQAQANLGIQSWGNLTHSYRAGLEQIQSRYPSNLLVKVNTNNKIEFVVKLQNLNDVSLISKLFRYYNVDIESTVPSLGVVVVWVPIANVDSFLKATSNNNFINYIEPNGYVQVQFTPNDPLWADQWGPQIIGAPTAWNQELGSRSIKVAVIDTGIDYNNPELKNNYLPLGYNWVYNNSNPMDDNGHGTHVSGTIAAAINNSIGIAGLANVSIFAEKFLNSAGFGSDVDAALAINHAVAQGANILSNSWGSTYNSSLVADAVANAVQSGAIFVAAAGNYGFNQPFFPADLPGVIGVAATDSADQRASFSDYGSYVDISAPGVNILSTWLNDTYAYESGTSMATPHVSGLLALLMSKFPQDNSTQLESIMYNTAVDLGAPGWDPYYGWGRIDAASAIFGLQPHNLQASISSPSIFPIHLQSAFNATIRNIGLNTENNVSYSVLINNTVVKSGKITQILPDQSSLIPVNITPNTISTYNLTLVVNPVPGENVTFDNIAMKYVKSATKTINMQVGDILSYNFPLPANSTGSGSLVPYDFAFKVTNEISPIAYNVSYIAYIDFGNGQLPQQITLYTSIVNPYTREMTNGPWGLFPYWINTTGLQVNDKVDLFTSGGQEGTVVGNGTYNYYGVQIPVILINDSVELVSFDKNTGVLLSVGSLFNSTATPYIEASYTNVMANGFDLHNLRGILKDVTGSPNVNSTIYFIVMNTGTYTESSSAQLDLNNSLLANTSFTLNPGEYTFFSALWSPQSSGTFPMNLTVTPVANETYLTDNYVNASAVSASAHIEVYVYDGMTYQAIAGAEVDIYNAINYTLIETGYTDGNGTYISSNLPLNSYIIQITAKGYESQSQFVTLSVPGQVIGLYFYLYPIPQQFVQILSPTTNETVQGGLVNVHYQATNIFNLYTISIYDNNNYVGTPYVYPSSISYNTSTGIIVVPVFENGTNTISLIFTWYDGSTANTSVTIFSEKVTPLYYPKIGDSINYRIDYSFTADYEYINITFVNWLTPTEINASYIITYFSGGNTTITKLWFAVNILNEFMNDSYDIMYGYDFQFITNLGYTNPNGHGSMGDITPNINWADILTVQSTTTWNGINAWVLGNDRNETWYYSRLSGILIYGQLNFGQLTIQLVNTTFPMIAPAPTVVGPGEVTYELGTSGNTLSWHVNGSYPDVYFVSTNGLVIQNGTWISGQNVNVNIDGLARGVYNYTIEVFNVGGWYTLNTVTVKVVDIPHINSPADVMYKIGETGAYIAWNASDGDPNTYTITRNGTFVNFGSWRTDVSIVIAVDVLPVGNYSYRLVVTDLEGYNATDIVMVYVLPQRGMPTPGFEGIYLVAGLSLLAIVSITLRKKKLAKK